jgi:hypothetical protein
MLRPSAEPVDSDLTAVFGVAHHGPAAPRSATALHNLVPHARFAGVVMKRLRWRQPPAQNHDVAGSQDRFGGLRLSHAGQFSAQKALRCLY